MKKIHGQFYIHFVNIKYLLFNFYAQLIGTLFACCCYYLNMYSSHYYCIVGEWFVINIQACTTEFLFKGPLCGTVGEWLLLEIQTNIYLSYSWSWLFKPFVQLRYCSIVLSPFLICEATKCVFFQLAERCV